MITSHIPPIVWTAKRSAISSSLRKMDFGEDACAAMVAGTGFSAHKMSTLAKAFLRPMRAGDNGLARIFKPFSSYDATEELQCFFAKHCLIKLDEAFLQQDGYGLCLDDFFSAPSILDGTRAISNILLNSKFQDLFLSLLKSENVVMEPDHLLQKTDSSSYGHTTVMHLLMSAAVDNASRLPVHGSEKIEVDAFGYPVIPELRFLSDDVFVPSNDVYGIELQRMVANITLDSLRTQSEHPHAFNRVRGLFKDLTKPHDTRDIVLSFARG